MGKKMRLLVLALLATLLFTVGCSKVTKKNYDKLKIGMAYSEVSTLLGKPDSCSESMVAKSCTWGNKTKNIKVNFVANKTVIFSCTGIK